MCGIAGFQGRGTREDAARMIGRIAYRGPDRRDVAESGDTVLAHARLSIIDLSDAAAQPMSDAAGEARVVFNGEIYNFRELRAELEGTGRHRFRTGSDTEVLLAMYREHGRAMLGRLNGMFAFALHDVRTGELFLARDRMGKKPLCWAECGGTFVFASELKAVLAHPAVCARLDPAALNEYLGFEYVPAPRTIVAGVRKLRPGHWLRVRDGRVVAEEPWWRPSFAKRRAGAAEAGALLDAALAGATARRLVSDVPLGVFLSGGIDSSTVAWYARQAAGGRLATFSVGFEEAGYDESAYARQVAAALGTDHHEETLRQRDGLELVPSLYALLDEPFADASLIPTHLLSRSARRRVTVCLGGDGADELLAGYPTFGADLAGRLGARLPRPLVAALQALARRLPASDADLSLDVRLRQFLGGLDRDALRRHALWLGSFTPAAKAGLLAPAVRAALGGADGLEPLGALAGEAAAAGGGLDRLVLGYLRTYLAEDILFKVDRASMYASLEVRAPFLDVEVVELVNSLPDRLKLRHGRGKWLLRRLMRGRLPDAVLDRPKKGFGIPLGRWLRHELRPLAEELLEPGAIARAGLFVPAAVERLKAEHFSGRANHRKQLWTLMAFELWRRQAPGVAA
jgi:asparagine synthase (glutamine-hydrolysing)